MNPPKYNIKISFGYKSDLLLLSKDEKCYFITTLYVQIFTFIDCKSLLSQIIERHRTFVQRKTNVLQRFEL